MDCLFPPALSEGQLGAYVEGEATRDITEHIAHCPPCQQRATRLAQQQRRLAAALYRAACPSSLELGEYQLHLLSPGQMQTIQAHLQSCPHCNRELAELRGFLADEPALSPIETGPGFLAPLRVLIAQLVDHVTQANPFGGPTPALAGLRGTPEEQYVYTADEIQVILEVKDDPEHLDRRVILGLILGLVLSEPGEVQLYQAQQALARSEIDELGNFVCSALPPGIYELVIRSGDVEVQIPNFHVA